MRALSGIKRSISGRARALTRVLCLALACAVILAPFAASPQRASAEDALPSRYDLRNVDGKAYVTGIRNQGSTNCCWAFAAIASMESSLMKQGIDNDPDLSEYHLTWFGGRSFVTAQADGARGDGYTIAEPLDFGGNAWIATSTLSRGTGPAYEADFPFDADNPSLMTGLDEPDRYVSEYVLIDTEMLESKDDIKRALMSGGALYCSYFASTGFLSADHKSYYSNRPDGVDAANHAVTVIGWDDDYPRDNFSSRARPSSDGAWLIKNSWGVTRQTYGDGYLWISYEDTSLGNFTAFTAARREADNVYQYDGAGFGNIIVVDGISTAYEANVFESRSDQTLTAASFISMNSNLYYSADVFANVPENGDPFDGELVVSAHTRGHFDHAGYHTVRFASPVPLADGERFAVVISLSDGDNDSVGICVEDDSSQSVYSGFVEKMRFYSEPGQSFVTVDGKWTDLNTDTDFDNVNVKAFSLNGISGTAVKTAHVPGDVDLDGTVGADDARTALRIAVYLDVPDAASLFAADFDRSEAVEASDARAILRKSVGLDP